MRLGDSINTDPVAVIAAVLEQQRRAFLADGYPSLAIRVDRLDRLARMVIAHEHEIVAALSSDFGGRSAVQTLSGDVIGGVNAIRYHRENLEAWMRPTPVKLPTSMEQAGARAEVRYEPLGVVGAMVPWNGPVLLSCLAAANVFAAGNRLMLKPSELAPTTAALLSRMFDAYFDASEAAVVEGGPDIAAAFAAQPYDHLLFTGSPAVARSVMRAAAEHLVPVTLELGGKSPVIVGASADLPVVARRLAHGKLASAGQVCVTPDYALVPKGAARQIAAAVAAEAARLYPTRVTNDDYTAIINDAHVRRLLDLLDDARALGAEIVEVNPAGEPVDVAVSRKLPLYLVLDPTDAMAAMQQEIFGPILPLMEYARIDDALAYVARHPHPLSAYYFGKDTAETARVVESVASGSMVVNDVRCQIFFEQLPFGGVGTSGMGRYRGYEGFRTFSNAKTVVYQMDSDAPLAAQRPPYDAQTRASLARQIEAMRGD